MASARNAQLDAAAGRELDLRKTIARRLRARRGFARAALAAEVDEQQHEGPAEAEQQAVAAGHVGGGVIARLAGSWPAEYPK